MKRITILAALLLALLLMLSVPATPRTTPWNLNNHVVGDDHPWGGESDDEDNAGQTAFEGDGPIISTGLTALDLFFNALILKYDFPTWKDNTRQPGTVIGPVENTTSDSETGQSASSTSNQGN